jgi:hypothetical protein
LAPSQTEKILLWKPARTANPVQTTGILRVDTGIIYTEGCYLNLPCILFAGGSYLFPRFFGFPYLGLGWDDEGEENALMKHADYGDRFS